MKYTVPQSLQREQLLQFCQIALQVQVAEISGISSMNGTFIISLCILFCFPPSFSPLRRCKVLFNTTNHSKCYTMMAMQHKQPYERNCYFIPIFIGRCLPQGRTKSSLQQYWKPKCRSISSEPYWFSHGYVKWQGMNRMERSSEQMSTFPSQR